MKNLNIWESFKDKRVRYGGYASMMTAFVVAILIIINLMVGQLDYKLDLTENKMFSLSQQTLDILDSLDQKITIYALTETGKENLIFDEALKKYSDYSNKIKVEYKDPVLYPQFATKYDKSGNSIS
ncbi:MAG TPA: Gldg family protein, partial [Defluviitaleaceae bacterium]|nr:Gldg family protein [Defluviitaleaceae bacterium]